MRHSQRLKEAAGHSDQQDVCCGVRLPAPPLQVHWGWHAGEEGPTGEEGRCRGAVNAQHRAEEGPSVFRMRNWKGAVPTFP